MKSEISDYKMGLYKTAKIKGESLGYVAICGFKNTDDGRIIYIRRCFDLIISQIDENELTDFCL